MKPAVGPAPRVNVLAVVPGVLLEHAEIVGGRTHRRWIQQHIAAGRVADVATGRRHDGGERNAEVQARVESLAIVLGAGYIRDACQRRASDSERDRNVS